MIPPRITYINSVRLQKTNRFIKGYPPSRATEVERMILYSLQVLQTLSWGLEHVLSGSLWDAIVLLGCHWFVQALGWEFQKIRWGPWVQQWLLTKNVPSPDSLQEAPEVQSEGRVSMFKPGGLDSVHSFSRYSDVSGPFFSCLFNFGFLSLDFFGGVLFPHGPQTSPTQNWL